MPFEVKETENHIVFKYIGEFRERRIRRNKVDKFGSCVKADVISILGKEIIIELFHQSILDTEEWLL